MFDLETAIDGWRRQMTAGGIKREADLDELEGHLRDDVERRVRAGEGEEAAFQAAACTIGRAEVIQGEYAKVAMRGWFRRAVLTLAGIPDARLVAAGAVQAPLEPRWATYVRAGAFMLPAGLLWMFSMVFIFPKLLQITREAGVKLPEIFDALFFFQRNDVVVCLALAGAFALVEWRSQAWPKYRRAAVGFAVFTLNAVVMMLITLMVILALVVVPAFIHPK